MSSWYINVLLWSLIGRFLTLLSLTHHFLNIHVRVNLSIPLGMLKQVLQGFRDFNICLTLYCIAS